MLVAPKFVSKISPNIIQDLADIPVPFGPVGLVAAKRTYCRERPGTGRLEDWHEVVERGCNGLLEIGGVFTQEQIEALAYYWHQLKGMPAGRPTWQLGTDTVRRIGGDSLNNCWCVAVNGPIDPFTFTFNELMLGGGVGFNIEPENVYEIPPVRYNPTIEHVDSFDCDLVVTDNREGWVELLRRILDGFFISGQSLRYCTKGLRAKGSPIRGFGGVASGPEPLIQGMTYIAQILRSRYGRKLTPTNALDILNIIAWVTVAGNVRRSAEIAIGHYQDQEFLEAKDWSKKTVPPWRQNSNNTVAASDTVLLPECFWRGYQPGCGESYGLINLDLCRGYGRLRDGEWYRPDNGVIGCNPCGEIPLESYEACNLAEQFLPNITDLQEFGRIASLLLRAAKAISGLKYWHPQSTEVIHRNRRIGIGITGYHQSSFCGDPDVFDAIYNHLEDEDRRLSREMNCPPSIKLTTVKPSGTLSLLADVTPGVHAAYAPFYIRRVSLAANSPLVYEIREHGYPIAPKINIDGSLDLGTLVADFPCRVPAGTRCADNYSAIDQLETQRFLQTHWADNSVSQTIYYRPEELPDIRVWLREHYAHAVKTTSFLLHQEHGFVQAPYEAITEDQYLELSARCKPIEQLTIEQELDLDTSAECGTGGCPIR
jgi:hypothetical protein